MRAAVIAEARTWLHTPWRHEGNVKGPQGAVDCAMFLAQVFINAGVIAPFDPRPYPRHWFLHKDEERFLGWVVDKLGGVEIAVKDAQPADLMIYQIGRCWAHGAILLEPKLVIHAFHKNGMVMLTETFDPELADRKPRAFDMFRRGRVQ